MEKRCEEKLSLLRLRLSHGRDKAHFRVSVSIPSIFGGGEPTESRLPFYEKGIDWCRTVQNAVGANRFVSAHFPDSKEQEWMVLTGLLKDNWSNFASDMQMQKKIGQKLYNALFPNGPVKRALDRARWLAQLQEMELPVELQIAADVGQYVRLHDYPWELVYDGNNFLAHCGVSFSRYIDFEGVSPQLSPTKQVNVLLVSSSAFDPENNLDELPEDEKEAVCQVLREAEGEGYICLKELKPATLRELRAYLTKCRGDETPHIIHFDGHGLFGRRCQECGKIHKGTKANECADYCGGQLSEPQGYLLFEHEEAKVDYVSAVQLGADLGQHHASGVAVVVLSACKSGLSRGSDSVFNGVAQNLISQRIPAVVAMQYSVSVKGATAFAEQFYRSLSKKDTLAKAVSWGRVAMGVETNQWYRPVLYLRWHDNKGGQIFAECNNNNASGNANGDKIPEKYNNRGVENYTQGQLNEALSDFDKALQTDPKYAEARYNRGVIYEDLRDFELARAEYKEAMLGGLAAAYNNEARLCIVLAVVGFGEQ